MSGVLIVRPDAPLWYANAQAVRDKIDDLVNEADPQVRVVVLDLDATDEIDITSTEHLIKLQHELERRGVQLWMAHVHAPAERISREAGLIGELWAEREFPTIDAAVSWAQSRRRRK